MPFRSEAQRRLFFAKLRRGEISKKTVDEWNDATPKDEPLPEHVKKAYAHGVQRATLTFKVAGEEIRLQIPRREFHNFDAAFRNESTKNQKKANEEPGAEMFAGAIEQMEAPGVDRENDAKKDPLERSTLWSSPSNPAAGDAGSRVDMGQPTGNGMV